MPSIDSVPVVATRPLPVTVSPVAVSTHAEADADVSPMPFRSVGSAAPAHDALAGADSVAFGVRRLGTVMEPEPGNPLEIEGVLNPAAATLNGHTYLFPRRVGAGNMSRIGVAEVRYGANGDPVGVTRGADALIPELPWEARGVEDARVTRVDALGGHVMTYVAVGDDGPRIAFATSRDLTQWTRTGLARLAPQGGASFADVDDKDAFVMPSPVTAPDGTESIALIHRPDSNTSTVDAANPLPTGTTERRPSTWVSYAPVERDADGAATGFGEFGQHRMVASPQYDWETLKVGGGSPPIQTDHGMLITTHGVNGQIDAQGGYHNRDYRGGLAWLDPADPSRVVDHTSIPPFTPRQTDQDGIVPNVVFPTGAVVNPHTGHINVYAGSADKRIIAYDVTMPGVVAQQ